MFFTDSKTNALFLSCRTYYNKSLIQGQCINTFAELLSNKLIKIEKSKSINMGMETTREKTSEIAVAVTSNILRMLFVLFSRFYFVLNIVWQSIFVWKTFYISSIPFSIFGLASPLSSPQIFLKGDLVFLDAIVQYHQSRVRFLVGKNFMEIIALVTEEECPHFCRFSAVPSNILERRRCLCLAIANAHLTSPAWKSNSTPQSPPRQEYSYRYVNFQDRRHDYFAIYRIKQRCLQHYWILGITGCFRQKKINKSFEFKFFCGRHLCSFGYDEPRKLDVKVADRFEKLLERLNAGESNLRVFSLHFL